MEWLENKRIAGFLCALLLLAAAAFYASVPLTSDVSFFVASAERLLAGERPYVDILETNPPMGFVFALVPVGLAHLAGAPSQLSYVVFVVACIAGSLWLVWRIGRGSSDRGQTVVALAVALTLAPGAGFGQREHFAAILLVPGLAAVMWRRDDGWLAVIAGVLAGLAVCIKPLFLLFPVAAEVWRLLTGGRIRDILRPQMISLGVLAAAFPFAVWWMTPAYYDIVVPMALKTYGAYQRPLVEVISTPAVLSFASLLTVALFAARTSAVASNGLWLLMALVGLGNFLIQSKGWPYQMLPGLVFATVALLRAAGGLRHQALAAGAMAVAFVVFGLNAAEFVRVQRIILGNFDELFAGGPRPRALLAMTFDNGVMFPYAPTRDIQWASSYPALWMMPAVAKAQVTGAEAASIVRFAAQRVAMDLARFQPDTVVVDRRAETPTLRGHRIEYLQLFGSDAEFAAQWQHYRLDHEAGPFQVWTRLPS